tara:strand:+ start:343 stop:528 length:186 start_codon:yes stop_codon:yes gene_type:complete
MKAIILCIIFLVSFLFFVLYSLESVDGIGSDEYPIGLFMSGIMSLTSILLLKEECKPKNNH